MHILLKEWYDTVFHSNRALKTKAGGSEQNPCTHSIFILMRIKEDVLYLSPLQIPDITDTLKEGNKSKILFRDKKHRQPVFHYRSYYIWEASML